MIYTFTFSIDTATVYRNEEAVGKLLKQAMKDNNLQRSDIFVTSKLGKVHFVINRILFFDPYSSC